ncbi:membrane protein insertion efficiency factor YidD [Isoptericola sp. NEAU-Y5]|uniref:Putative membrane protein insertion efficiency factor n=1 Tax=Isoptericola luteus TaxID=2879484 RepID=A0ABS7ZGH9_9MICO|nr:membrane protein insertion efficiency factor YidD [Isoptericola sp. NEAU-Y5]MCA5894134.1 membrane protein insertion efficiency factor YidD [Isoptericola sp. NEAU-Y5]
MSAATLGREALRNLPTTVLIGMIRVYQAVVSPLTGPTCKYYPSCSQYAIIAVRTHGTLRGTGLALWRILRCNPWSLGGVDDVPPARSRHTHDDVRDHGHRGA